MKSFLVAVILVTLGWTFSPAQGPDQHRVIKVGVFPIDPIVSVVSGEEPQGFFVDLINEVARQENWQVVFVPGTWHDGLERLKDGRIDLMTAVAFSEDRTAWMQFNTETVLTVWGQVFSAPGHGLQTILDLEGKRVALAIGDINGVHFRETAQKFGVACEFQEVPTHEDIFQLIQSGQVDAGVAPNVYGIAHAGDFGIVGTSIIFSPVESRFAAPKSSDGSLLRTIDTHLVSWKQEEHSFYYQSLDHCLGLRGSSRKTLPLWALGAGGIILLLSFILFFWNRILNRKFQARTRELRISEAKQRVLFDQSFQFIGLLNPEGILLDVNQTALDFIGAPASEVIGRPFWEAPWWAHSAVAQDEIRQGIKIAAEGGIFQSVATHPAADGTMRYVEFSVKGIRDDSGAVRWLVPEGRDITEYRATQEQLARLGQAVEQAAEAVIITNADGVMDYVNPAFVQVTGYEQDEAVGKKLQDFCSQDHDTTLYSRTWFEMLAGESWRGRSTNLKRDGSTFEVDASVSPILDEVGNVLAYVILQRDMTQVEELERNLRQSQRLEAVGTLAAGIAHDFNNILAAIFGYTELAQLSLDKSHPAAEYLDEVIIGAERARTLVRQILVFGRRSELEWQSFALGDLVREVLELLRSTMPATISVEEDLGIEGQILGDPGQIHQVLMNLCTNAFHALEDRGGALKVALDKEEIGLNISAGEADVGLSPGTYLVMTVEDNGPGMDSQLLEKIFQPYFTTKDPGKGTGLGLAVVHGIVQAHHGRIEVESHLGKGTRVRVLLPEFKDDLVSEESFGESGSQQGHGEHILFVDDEEVLGRLAKMYFTDLGYRVSAYTDSTEAWSVFKNAPDDFDLIISDQTMPGMTGIDLASYILALKPETPYILCTGYSADISRGSTEELGINRFVQKPVEMEKLGMIVRGLLDQIHSP